MSLRRGRLRAELNAEINVVSLIDVMMLLLVIFMITAPMMQGGIEITLPQADGRPLTPKSGFVITVTRNDVYFNETKLSTGEFRASFKSLVGSRGREGVALQVDAGVPFQRFVTVMEVISKAGVQVSDIVTAPVEGPPR